MLGHWGHEGVRMGIKGRNPTYYKLWGVFTWGEKSFVLNIRSLVGGGWGIRELEAKAPEPPPTTEVRMEVV